MPQVRIVDAHDTRLDIFRLNERQLFPRDQRRNPADHGLFIAEGDLVVERAFAAGCQARALLCSERFAMAIINDAVDVYIGDTELRREVTGLGVPLDALGVFERPTLPEPTALLRSARRVVAFEAVDNPTNIGAVTRSAAALGWDAMALDWSSADPFARRALRVSMGTAFAMPFCRIAQGDPLVESLNQADLTTIALTPDPSATDIREFASDRALLSGRIAVVLGAERTGLTEASIDASTLRARIPMQAGVDSLNVANAASIALFALA